MIHHISISAHNPLQVAQALADVWQGRVFAFYPIPGSYMVTASAEDQYGTAIEVHPWQVQLVPGTNDEGCQMEQQATPLEFGAVHAAISVPTNEEQIRQVADRAGWRVVKCDRRAFSLIELWVENRFMLELLTPEQSAQYLAFTRQPQLVEQVFGLPIVRNEAVLALA